MRREKPDRKSVANAEKLRYPSLPPVNIQTLKIGELKPNIYFSNEKYVSLDALIDGIRVLVACINQFQLAKQSLKKPVKQILRRRIEKKKENVAPKNVWFGD